MSEPSTVAPGHKKNDKTVSMITAVAHCSCQVIKIYYHIKFCLYYFLWKESRPALCEVTLQHSI